MARWPDHDYEKNVRRRGGIFSKKCQLDQIQNGRLAAIFFTLICVISGNRVKTMQCHITKWDASACSGKEVLCMIQLAQTRHASIIDLV